MEWVPRPSGSGARTACKRLHRHSARRFSTLLLTTDTLSSTPHGCTLEGLQNEWGRHSIRSDGESYVHSQSSRRLLRFYPSSISQSRGRNDRHQVRFGVRMRWSSTFKPGDHSPENLRNNRPSTSNATKFVFCTCTHPIAGSDRRHCA